MKKRSQDKNWISFGARVVCLMVPVFILSGCSIAGFFIGSKSDAKKRANDTTFSLYELDKIKVGDFVEIHTVYGEIFKGRFRGSEKAQDQSIELILLEKKNQILKIRASDVKDIVVFAEKAYVKWIFAAIGAVFDAFAVMFLINGGDIGVSPF